jgi:CspA family cold shock protein
MSQVGSVKWFDTKKGWGFITVLTQDVEESNTDVFVHYTNLTVGKNEYKRLFPGEYVSFSIGKGQGKDGRDICINVMGVMGGPLLTEHPEYRYKFFPRNPQKSTKEVAVEDDTVEADDTVEEN